MIHHLFRDCPFCGKNHGISLTGDQVIRIASFLKKQEKSIQDEFPDLTADQREFILTGICSECWDQMGKEDDK